MQIILVHTSHSMGFENSHFTLNTCGQFSYPIIVLCSIVCIACILCNYVTLIVGTQYSYSYSCVWAWTCFDIYKHVIVMVMNIKWF